MARYCAKSCFNTSGCNMPVAFQLINKLLMKGGDLLFFVCRVVLVHFFDPANGLLFPPDPLKCITSHQGAWLDGFKNFAAELPVLVFYLAVGYTEKRFSRLRGATMVANPQQNWFLASF